MALVFLVLFIAIFLTAHITVVKNANHKCIGDGCPICRLIHNAENLIRQIGKAILSISVLRAVLFTIAAGMIMGGLCCAVSSTPINIKVRLNI